MDIIIKRFLISIAILATIVILVTTVLNKTVYVITYDTYMYDPESQKHLLDNKNEHIFINAYTKQGAIDDATEFLYLNNLLISDSIDIKDIQEF